MTSKASFLFSLIFYLDFSVPVICFYGDAMNTQSTISMTHLPLTNHMDLYLICKDNASY